MYDLIVIGAGPGGSDAAIHAARQNKKVLLIEKDKIGGVCLNRGCIPTKALIKGASILKDFVNYASLGINAKLESTDYEKAVSRSKNVINTLAAGLLSSLKRYEVELVYGEAKIISPNEVMVNDSKYLTKFILLATGARCIEIAGTITPYQFLELSKLPDKVKILGSGAIGLEFAYILSAYQVDVTIYEKEKKILPRSDDDLSRELTRHLKGINIITGTTLEDFNDLVIAAVGTRGIIPENNLNLKTDGAFLKVDNNFRTNLENIYAIGDVVGLNLAHAASFSGRQAVDNMFSGRQSDHFFIPSVIYTHPQVASFGRSENYLKENNITYKVKKVNYRGNGKSLADGKSEGFLKLLMNDKDKFLGVHIVHDMAGELLSEFMMMYKFNLKASDMLDIIHPHPSVTEWNEYVFRG